MLIELDELINAGAKAVGTLLAIDKFSLLIFDERKKQLVVKAVYGMSEDMVDDVSLKKDTGISGKVFSSGKMILINDLEKEKTYLPHRPLEDATGSFFYNIYFLKFFARSSSNLSR